jgi:hypothetical protein
MASIRRNLQLHHKTVQKAAKGEVSKLKKARRPRRKANSKVVVTHWYENVDTLILVWAKEHKIDPRKIEVVNRKSVIVHNKRIR